MNKSIRALGFATAVFGTAAILAAMNLATCAAATDSAGQEKSGAKLPAKSADLRPSLNQWGLEPRVQGNRGTCSIFAMTGALEYALATKQQHGTRLSVEFLNWAGNQTGKENGDGGSFDELWKGYLAHGI